MGYTTDFDGEFAVTPTLKPEHVAYLKKFSETRRMKRDPDKAATMPDPIRVAASLPLGDEGAYVVAGGGFMGQGKDESILDYNRPPKGQPGLWCQWVPSEDGSVIVWDEGEKFYMYVDWLVYLIEHFLKPWGYALNGEVSWQGADNEDMGVIFVGDNHVEALPCEIVRPRPSWESESV